MNTSKLGVLLLILFLICIFFFVSQQKKYVLSENEQLVNSVLAETAKIIKNKYNLRPCGAGAAMPGGPIQQLTLCFDTPYPYTKEQLRKALIETSQELLFQVSKNREIQKFLKTAPFTIKNTEIIIYNHDEDGRGLRDPDISTARISQGTLIYRIIDSKNSLMYRGEFEENYQDALKEAKLDR